MDVLRSQLNATLWLADGVVAVPERATFIGELAALLATVSVPVSLAALLGSKFTV